ncbi:hypothetical protein [Streptacidiphilus sp. EB129]|jgi:hypothetical protein|uniref:hypothetical protein n=1 Tax=Streptacidiphilus sp. EB129 TaxID=3156262 RepID=UPI0035182EA7
MNVPTTPRPARRCDFCQQPADGITVRADVSDPTSKRVAINHADCFREYVTGLPIVLVEPAP